MKTWEVSIVGRKGSTPKVYWEKTVHGFAIPEAQKLLEEWNTHGFDKVPDSALDDLVITLQIKRVDK